MAPYATDTLHRVWVSWGRCIVLPLQGAFELSVQEDPHIRASVTEDSVLVRSASQLIFELLGHILVSL